MESFLAVSRQHLVWTVSCKQTIHAKTCQSSPLKCSSRDSWRLACVLEQDWLTASCLFISPVTALPRLSSSAEWYLRHKLLRFSWVELMLLCWLWSSFCISYRIKICREGYSSHSREIFHILHSGMFFGNWCCWNPLNNVYIFVGLFFFFFFWVCVIDLCWFFQNFVQFSLGTTANTVEM